MTYDKDMTAAPTVSTVTAVSTAACRPVALAADLRVAVTHAVRRIRQERSSEQITDGQYAVLAALSNRGPMTPTALAEDQQVQPPHITRVINALVAVAVGPFAVGFTLAAMLLVTGLVTGGGVNPARSTAAALFSGGAAIGQLWLFWLAPLLGAAIVGLFALAFAPVAEPFVDVVVVDEDLDDEDLDDEDLDDEVEDVRERTQAQAATRGIDEQVRQMAELQAAWERAHTTPPTQPPTQPPAI